MSEAEAKDFEKNKKHRRAVRSTFTRLVNQLTDDIGKENLDVNETEGRFQTIVRIHEELRSLDTKISDYLFEIEENEVTLGDEVSTAYGYLESFNRISVLVQSRLNRFKPDDLSSNHSNSSRPMSENLKSRLKLPTIELTKFSGNLKDWLPFWGIFKRIDEDDTIDSIDKYHYLVQATLPNSKARQIVDSYLATGENYHKVIKSLKSRFGREDLLIEVYVRELLKLLLNNMSGKVVLSTLFDRLESQIRALDTLGVTTDKCSAILYPLVESCLPEELLRAWQRHSDFDSEADLKDRLDVLMKFLQTEVTNEERIVLAASGFDDLKSSCVKSGKSSMHKPITSNKRDYIPTASGLVNQKVGKPPLKCVFCGAQHLTEDCRSCSNLTVSEKVNLLSTNRCCYRCTKYGHVSKKCHVKLNCSNCNGRHATIMCDKTTDTADIKDSTLVQCERNLANNAHNDVFLQTVRVNVRGKSYERTARVIFDSGSQQSYILEKTAVEMGYISERKEKLNHALFGGSVTGTIDHNCYKVRVSDLSNTYYCNFEVLDQDVICNNVSTVKAGPWMDELKFSGINISDTVEGPIEILIGSDVAGKLFTGKRQELSSGLVAMETLLGWVLMGKVILKGTRKSSSMTVTSLLSPNLSISDLWSLDVLGIKDPVSVKTEFETKSAAMNNFIENVSVNSDGRYEVKLPWIEDHPPLPTNLEMAKRRLDSLVVKLDKSGHFDSYQNVLTDWENLGIIEQVPEANLELGHYLPHRHVIKESSATTKLRPVFDASAKERAQPSLNDCLWKGENLIESIPSILNRFRLHKYGVVSDIEKAFLQISLDSNERDFLRFLWVNKEEELVVYRHARVVFGVTCSPFLLGTVINLHLERTLQLIEYGLSEYSKEVVLQLLKSFYVDNCMASFENESDLEFFINQSTKIMAEAKFCLRGWENTVSNTSDTDVLTPVLGLNWNRQVDTLEINMDNLTFNESNLITKRVILSFAHKLFDPIGFTCPVVLLPKILLQKTWESNMSWDEEVPNEVKVDFLKWIKELDYLKLLKIPRHFAPGIQGEISWSIHCFCDASKNAYAAAVFLRGESNGQVTLQLVQAKSRVSPVKQMSIPRLELMGATIGARLTNSVLESIELKDVQVFYWTDSTTVLSWIRREDQWAVFVWNRVREIRALTNIQSWNYVPGHLNPADLPSRGCSPKHLVESKWWEGPYWLKESPDNWPDQNQSNECDEDVVRKELKKKSQTTTLISKTEHFIDWYLYFSRYDKLLRMVGWILRFIDNSRKHENRTFGPLVKDEIVNAETKVFGLIQKDSFLGLKDVKLKSLCVFEDSDGLIKLKTKLIERPDTKNFRYPIVLPSDHPVVHRLIRHTHEENCHVGVQGLLTLLREDLWIICGRKTVKSVVDKCIICKRYSAKKLVSIQVQLPLHRVRDAGVFEISGIDFAGPVFLRGGQKAWIALYTCAVYRAVHLELVTSLSTDTFLQSLRRFISRRGRPAMICTDNGTNFQGAANAFNRLDWDKIIKCSSIKRIEWKFNPPASPWWGGWWERLVRLLKQLLRKVLGKAYLNYEELTTILCDCEYVINARPLTYVSEDSGDMAVLTPAMFLHDSKEYGVTDINCIEKMDLSRRWSYRLKLREDLHKRFRSEYLSQLVLHSKKSKNRPVTVGEIVLIGSDNEKRTDWPLARVQKTFKGKDGNVRLVELKTSKGALLRPIQHVYPMEIIGMEDHKQEEVKFGPKPNNRKEDIKVQVTKRGRLVTLPKRLCD